ncbi:MAG TPA: type II toxin-antitoxin system VapC family toxin [Tepidiformaceae bacterium]|nr:type II toxin-antitoxin system VapC family toxin [Tepidiformaceae bacterium]
MICLDTHTWVRWVADPSRLPPEVRRRLDADDACVSSISIWEVSLLVIRGELRLRQELPAFLEAAVRWEGLQVVPISPPIAIRGARLGPLFPADPADRLIASTALELECPLATADARIAASGVVEVLWD